MHIAIAEAGSTADEAENDGKVPNQFRSGPNGKTVPGGYVWPFHVHDFSTGVVGVASMHEMY